MREYPISPKERRPSNVAKGFFFAIILIIVSVYCSISAMFSGGINGLVSNLMPAPNPNSWIINAKGS